MCLLGHGGQSSLGDPVWLRLERPRSPEVLIPLVLV